MKKLFVIVVAVMVSSAAFAQTDSKTAAPAPAAATPAVDAVPATTPAISADAPAQVTAATAHSCYTMQKNALMHCTGTDAVPQKTDVTLKNGTVITAKGTVSPKEGAKTQLVNGQCIDMAGQIGDFEVMHKAAKK